MDFKKRFESRIFYTEILLLPTIGIIKMRYGLYGYKYRFAFAWLIFRFSFGFVKAG